MEALDLGVLEALSTLLLDSQAADDALDLALSVVETSVLTGGRERLCWSLACVSDCLARLDFQHSARTAAESALTFLAEAPPDAAAGLARRIHYRLSVQLLRIGKHGHARRHHLRAARAHSSIAECPLEVWQVKIPWLQGLLDSSRPGKASVRSLQHFKQAEDAAFRQRLTVDFCHIALQKLQIALDLGCQQRFRDMVVDIRTKAIVLLEQPTQEDLPERFCSMLFLRGVSTRTLRNQVAELLELAAQIRPDHPVLSREPRDAR